MRACAVQAVIPEPYLHFAIPFWEVSPAAKVIIMKRDFAAFSSSRIAWVGWKTVARASIAWDRLPYYLCHWLPLGLIWPDSEPGHSFVRSGMASMFLEECMSHCTSIYPGECQTADNKREQPNAWLG
eukprot:gnl/TRDRNA2_/TRDRNA2_155798_c3_seq1.p1 gnl/TRDRNA2_/TRDRNA2_155798_c3~~gnl/TRDRNA2_/TRDRNA2_155798_c3_seq1.p1  ORF type:complete len:127 (+),score=9.03 gnl/TRDRNA2_/TRDRNA2_155798_c3_seq1:2-382(+)